MYETEGFLDKRALIISLVANVAIALVARVLPVLSA